MKALFLILGLVAVGIGVFAIYGIFWCIGALNWLVINLYVQYMLRNPKVQDLCNKLAEEEYRTSYENLSDWDQEGVAEEAINKVSRLPFRITVDSYYSAKTNFFPYGLLTTILLALALIIALGGGSLLWHFIFGEPFITCN